MEKLRSQGDIHHLHSYPLFAADEDPSIFTDMKAASNLLFNKLLEFLVAV